MKTITGDLLEYAREGKFGLIVHGCNCMCTMGAGIAAQIRRQFPAAYAADQATRHIQPEHKLGMMTAAEIEPYGFTLVNAYTQLAPNPPVSYDAIRSCFQQIKLLAGNKPIGYPMIGAGLARGDWGVISGIIDECLEGCDHTLVVLP